MAVEAPGRDTGHQGGSATGLPATTETAARLMPDADGNEEDDRHGRRHHEQLLDSGTHFGHQTRRWNPKMKRFIFTDRNGIYIIDLQQTLTYIDKAYEFVKETVAHGGSIMFVGTKKQAQESIAEEATASACRT